MAERFTAADREAARRWLLDAAKEDAGVAAAAITGSGALDAEDEWSDIDVALAIESAHDMQDVIERWTAMVGQRFGITHYWDLPADRRLFRVFLLPNGLEIDIGFTPADVFGARGPAFRLVFGQAVPVPEATVDRRSLIGMGWHHILHAAACIARGKPWEAEWLISAARDHTLALACVRLGLPAVYARGVDRLPEAVRSGHERSLIRSMNADELARALSAVRSLFLEEVRAVEPTLTDELERLLPEVKR